MHTDHGNAGHPFALAEGRCQTEFCLWWDAAYPQALKALAAHPAFKSRLEADLYICGYWRGLQMAAYLIVKASLKWADAADKKIKKADQKRKKLRVIASKNS